MSSPSDKRKQLFVLDSKTSSLRVIDRPSRKELPKLQLDASLQEDPDALYLYNIVKLPSWLIELMKPQERRDRCKGPIPFDDNDQTRMEQFVGAFLVSSFAKTHNAESTTGKIYKYLVENGIREPTFIQVQTAYENIVLKVKNKYFYEKARLILQKKYPATDPTQEQIEILAERLQASNKDFQYRDETVFVDIPKDAQILDPFLDGLPYEDLVRQFSTFSTMQDRKRARPCSAPSRQSHTKTTASDTPKVKSNRKILSIRETVSRNELPRLDLDSSLGEDEDAFYLYNMEKLPSWLLELMTSEQRRERCRGTISFNAMHQARMTEFIREHSVVSYTKTHNASRTTERIYRYLVKNGIQEPTIQQVQNAYENIVLKVKNNYFYEKAKFIWENKNREILPTEEQIQVLVADLIDKRTSSRDVGEIALATIPYDADILDAFLDEDRPLKYDELVKRYSTFQKFQPNSKSRRPNPQIIDSAPSVDKDQVPSGLWVKYVGSPP